MTQRPPDLVTQLERKILIGLYPDHTSIWPRELLQALATNFPGCPDIALEASLNCKLLPEPMRTWLADEFKGWRRSCVEPRKGSPPPWWLWPHNPQNHRYFVEQEGNVYTVKRFGFPGGAYAILDLNHKQIAIMDRPRYRDEYLSFIGLEVYVVGWCPQWKLPFGVPAEETVIQIVTETKT